MQKSCLGWIPGAVLSAALGVHVYAASGDAYTWPGYRSDLDYDTKSNLGDIQPPTKFNNNCSGVTGKKAGKWWAFYWGKDRDSRGMGAGCPSARRPVQRHLLLRFGDMCRWRKDGYYGRLANMGSRLHGRGRFVLSAV